MKQRLSIAAFFIMIAATCALPARADGPALRSLKHLSGSKGDVISSAPAVPAPKIPPASKIFTMRDARAIFNDSTMSALPSFDELTYWSLYFVVEGKNGNTVGRINPEGLSGDSSGSNRPGGISHVNDTGTGAVVVQPYRLSADGNAHLCTFDGFYAYKNHFGHSIYFTETIKTRARRDVRDYECHLFSDAQHLICEMKRKVTAADSDGKDHEIPGEAYTAYYGFKLIKE